ncbi:MAG: hypothetical protein K1X66_02390 [Verrucomicrobiae bacterium]|nr:hypothetical protein [Verrucomicrobiae bacterium]
MSSISAGLSLADTVAKIGLEVINKNKYELVEEERKKAQAEILKFAEALDGNDNDGARLMADSLRQIRVDLPLDLAKRLRDGKIILGDKFSLLGAYAASREREFYQRALEIVLLKDE